MNVRGALVVLCMLVAGRASCDDLVKIYADPAFDGTVSNVLVVGIHSDSNVRGIFESSVVRALRATGAVGDSSLARMGSTEPLTAATVLAAARRMAADSVLVTRVVDIETRNPEATTTFVEYFDAYASYQDPLPVMTTHTVRVRLDLYTVASERKVWEVESTVFDKQNLFGVIDGIAKAVAAQLRADGLIGGAAAR